MNEQPRQEKGFYVAEMTITILARNEQACEKALDTLAYAADCIENDNSDMELIAAGDPIELTEEAMRDKLRELDIEPYLIGLQELDE